MFKKRQTSVLFIAIVLLIVGAGITFLAGSGQSKEWRSIRDRILPQFMPVEKKTLTDVVSWQFTDEVDIGFVVDADKKYQFVDSTMLQLWGVTVEELYDKALDNLDARSRNIKVEVAQASDEDETAKYIIVELDDGYAAVRLLSSGVRRAIARELGDEYIAAIPTRDFLIFWHRNFPLFDAFDKQVQIEFSAEEQYALTPALFLVNKYGIQPVEKEAPVEEALEEL